MVIKVYISGISGRKEVKKHQQRVMMIMDSKNIEYLPVDITEPGNEQEKEFMLQNGKSSDNKTPVTPQIFNDEVYCGDYDAFDLSNEVDELDIFLKLKTKNSSTAANDEKPPSSAPLQNGQVNGVSSREASAEKEAAVSEEKPASDAAAAAAEEPATTTEETPAASEEQ